MSDLRVEFPFELSRSQNKDIDWMMHKRNKHAHGNEIDWKQIGYSTAYSKISSLYTLIFRLYSELSFELSNFSLVEQNILRKEKLTWQDEGLSLLKVVTPYIYSDPDIVFKVAHDAIEIALRGFAQYWNIPESQTTSLENILNQLREKESECPDATVEYTIFDRDSGNYESIDPPLNADLQNLRKKTYTFWTNEQVLQHHLDDVQELIYSYSTRIQRREYIKCIMENFRTIWEKLMAEAPHLNPPTGVILDFKWLKNSFEFHPPKDFQPQGTGEEYDRYLKKFVTEICGEIPKDLTLDFFPTLKTHIDLFALLDD